MKRPSISFDKDAIVDFLLRHVEKMLAVLIGVFACSLVWGGITAVRTRPPRSEQQPPAILAQANRAAQNIESVKNPPDDAIKDSELSSLIEPWRVPELANQPAVALLNKPLFDEKAKRTKPAVLPIEDLRAVAGIAVLPVKNAPAAMPARNAADLDGPPNAADAQKKPKRGGRGRPDPKDAEQNAGGPPAAAPRQNAAPKARLVPFCIVTGLIPFAKQTSEYGQRFEQAGLRDPKRDLPLWSDYLIERTVVRPDGRETWERIDVKAAAKAAQKEWAAVQSEQLPADFLLAAERSPGAVIGYCAPLPQRAGEAWGPEAIHPWFVEQLKKIRAERAAEKAAAESAGPEAAGNQAVPPDFQSPLDPPPVAVAEPQPVAVARKPADGPEYRLFRFVDTAVEIGKSYRYRVRLSVWNPNYNLPAQHLSDATLSKEQKLPSPSGNATAAVEVPDTKTLLVRTLRKADTKRFKPGTVEVLVLGEDADTGDYSLRSLLTEAGGLANVDKSLNRPGDTRMRGEDIVTDRVLVDIRGKQEDRAEARTNKPTPPPEPLEMLFLRDDGRFEVASAADSQPMLGRYIATLPAAEEPKAGGRDQPEQPQGNPGNPFANPFRQ